MPSSPGHQHYNPSSHPGSQPHSPAPYGALLHLPQQHVGHGATTSYNPYSDYLGGGHLGPGGYASHPPSPSHAHARGQPRSPGHPIYPAYGTAGVGRAPSRQGATEASFPWFAAAAAANVPLDASLSGNSAFILPSSSQKIVPSRSPASDGDGDGEGELQSSPSSHALLPLAGSGTDEEGILPDELDRLLQHYGQPSAVLTLGMQQDSVAEQPRAATASKQSRQASAARNNPAAAGGRASGPLVAAGQVALAAPSNHTPRGGSAAASSEQLGVDPLASYDGSLLDDENVTAGGGGGGGVAPSMSPLSPGGASLEVGSQEWLAGSVSMLPVPSPLPDAPAVSGASLAANGLHIVSQLPPCSLCDEEPPTAWCVSCSLAYCAGCCASFHKPAKQAGHTIQGLLLKQQQPQTKTLQPSGSRASLGRPAPRVADPFPVG